MIDLTTKDRELLRSLWPWGVTYFMSLLGLLLLSWILAGASFAGLGNLFFFFLVVPFAWFGIAEYSRSLIARGVSVWFVRLIGFIYLSVLATKFLLAFSEKSDWLPLLIVMQIAAVGYAWARFSASRNFAELSSHSKVRAHHLWLEDVLLLSLMIAFVVIM
jgi:hypothetical protein